jgi:hypothetical protein
MPGGPPTVYKDDGEAKAELPSPQRRPHELYSTGYAVAELEASR